MRDKCTLPESATALPLDGMQAFHEHSLNKY
ncbi:MAG: hypothetical protein RL088_3472 [Verrucomicrobiota bacterium]